MRKQKILIVLFAGSLVLPGVVWAGFSGRFDTENNENRKLAEFPEVNLESLGDFPEQFEAYYKDHVPFKNDLVKFCNFIDTEFFRNTKIGDVVIGEDNWLFYLPEKMPWQITRKPMCIHWNKVRKLHPELQKYGTGSWTGV